MKIKITVDVSECMPLILRMLEEMLSEQMQQPLQQIRFDLSCLEDKVENFASDSSSNMWRYEDLD